MTIELEKSHDNGKFRIDYNSIYISDGGRGVTISHEEFQLLCKTFNAYTEMVKLEKELD